MNRLTKVYEVHDNKPLSYEADISNYPDLMGYEHEQAEIDIINKLGQLEDLEESIGCPLEVVFKALKQCYIYVDMGIFEHPRIKDIQKQKVNFINFTGEYFHIGYTHDYGVALCDYGKTWWLKGDKVE